MGMIIEEVIIKNLQIHYTKIRLLIGFDAIFELIQLSLNFIESHTKTNFL